MAHQGDAELDWQLLSNTPLHPSVFRQILIFVFDV